MTLDNHMIHFGFGRVARCFPRVGEWFDAASSAWGDLAWRVRRRFWPDHPIRLQSSGIEYSLCPDGQIARALWWADFEAWERDFVASYLRPGMRMLDIGANVGLYSVLAGIAVGSRGRVDAFEPSPTAFGRLTRNLKLNGLRHVRANQIALSDRARTLVLRADAAHPEHDGHVFVEEVRGDTCAGDAQVSGVPLDQQLAHEVVAAPVDFVKIDVEGSELQVLRGAERLLASTADLTILLECTRSQREVEALLTAHGFRFFAWDRVARRLTTVDFLRAAATGNVVARRSPWCA